jgi:predicted nucleotidyltransferase
MQGGLAMNAAIATHEEKLRDLCCRFHVQRLEVFGSAARQDFDPEKSDFDFLVEFAPLSATAYADAFFGFKAALERLLGRPADLVVASAIRNPYFRQSIEQDKTLLYAA